MPPSSAGTRLASNSSAAPMPRLGSVCDDKVCRVPKPTRESIVWRSWPALTGATIARSFASARAAARRRSERGRTADREVTHRDSPLSSAAATGISRCPGLGEPRSQTHRSGRISMLRSIDHFIGGSSFASGERQRRRVRPQPGPGPGPCPPRHRRRPPEGDRRRARPRSRPGPRPTRSAAPG